MNTSIIDEKYAATLKYKPQEFARILGVSVKTLQRWDRDGTLKAHRTLTNRRYYTFDQFKDVSKDQHQEGIMEKRRSMSRDYITRGELCVMIRDILLECEELNTPEGIEFLQQLIDDVLELPAYWPILESRLKVSMKQSVKLDFDLIRNSDVTSIIYKYWKGQPDDSPKGIICRKVVDWIDNVEISARTRASI